MKVQALCERCGWPLFPLMAGACPNCRVRPDERLVRPTGSEFGRDLISWEWRVGRDGKKRAVYTNGRKA